jgi:esterase/lipase superfamily enzyme
VFDLTAVDDGEGNHHSKYSKSEPVIAAIGKGLRKDASAKSQSGVVSAITDVGNSLLKVPSAVLETSASQ